MTRNDLFPIDKHFFFDDAKAVAAHVLQHDAETCKALIQAADEVAAQRFTFTLRWDMERTNEPVVFEGAIDWLHQPGDDPEWVYAFNRMRFWICLGQAYAMTGDEKYATAFVQQLLGWIQTVKQQDPACAKAWRSIEVGLRLDYWLKAMQYFKDSPAITDEVASCFIESIMEQSDFLMNVWDSYHIMSNWGVLENHGLFMAGMMLPESARSAQYRDTAAARLQQQIRMQVYRDGTHWEQSPMYHNEVLMCYLEVVLLARRNGYSLPEPIEQKVHEMSYADFYSAKPNHCELSRGDSDDIDQRDLISRAAVLFADSDLKFGGYDIPDFDTAWDIGEQGLADYAALARGKTPPHSHYHSDSGNMYFRTDWSEESTFLHFHCGTLGAGHGHADKLHVDVFSRGEDVLLDAGRYTYVFGEDRIAYKQMCAHNTIMVDGLDRYICKDSWECSDLARGINRHFYADDAYGYAEGGHTAYMNLEHAVLLNRRVIFLKPDIIVLADECYTGGAHSYQQFFHFNNLGTLQAESNTSYRYESAKLRAQVQFLTPQLDSRIVAQRFSLHYNEQEASRGIETQFSGNGFTSAYTILALGDHDDARTLKVEKRVCKSNFKGITFRDEEVEALDIQYGAQHFTLVLAHQEYATPTDTVLVDGCTGFGSCIVFDRAKGETEIGTVLQW